ncbi:hypothetical protein Q9R32_06815 [Actinotalea sp. AC32]|nr:hypothetical protein [Actinotalea sp. AC32]
MVAHLVRLKLAILANGLRRSPWQVVGLVAALLYAAGVLAGVLVVLAVLSVQDVALRETVLVLMGSVLVLGWWLVPLVAFGVDATMDPDRFALLPVPRGRLLLGMALAALVGVPGLMTVVGSLGAALSWWRSPPAIVAGGFGAVAAVATAVVGSRLLTTALGPVLGGRRVRDLLAVVAIVPLVLMGPIVSTIEGGLVGLEERLPSVAAALGWTPIGAPWALPADVATGRWADAGLRAALCVAAVGALVVAWYRLLGVALVRPRRASSGRSRAAGLGLLGVLPANPLGAVAARCLVYWLRDPRYSSSVVVVPLMPVVLGFAGDGGPLLLASAPVAAYVFGWAVSADVSYDHTAFWTHVAAPVRGVQDRLGRVVAAAALGLPATLALALGTLAVTGRWEHTVAVVGVSVAVLATGLGVSSVASARVVVPVAKPGDSPFSTPQGGSGAAMLSQLAGTAILGLLLLPSGGLVVASVATGRVGLGVAGALLGLVVGATVLVVGVRWGGRLYDRRAPELMERLVAMA